MHKTVKWTLYKSLKYIDNWRFSEYNGFTDKVKRGEMMKLNYTEKQYVQLAKEKFCQILKEVPFVSDIEIISTGLQRGFGDFHAVIYFADNEETIKFCIEVEPRGERRFVNKFMLMASQHVDGSFYMFMAPYISEASAEAMREKKYGYMDLSGNCYILTKRIMIYITGKQNKYVELRTKKNYFSKSASAASVIMRTILDDYQKTWQVKELSNITGKAIGTVSNVKSFLLDHAWIEELPGGFRVCNVREMLYDWAKDYQKKDSRLFEYYSLDSIPEIESAIAKWNDKHGASAVLGSFSAAVRYAPVVRYNKVHVYVEQQDFEEFIADLNLKQVASGGNVIITIPHDETPCMFPNKINGDVVTSPVQTVIDLLTGGGRGEEAAAAIILKEFDLGDDNDKR